MMIRLSRLVRRNFAFFIILIFALLVRLYVFDYPLVSEETNRDFLIARHIAKYQEFVSLGPKNGTLPTFGNSPAYFYFLAAQFAIFDSVMFVSFVNLLAQLATIVFLYFIVKKIFGVKTALIASLFFSFAGLSITASVWPWQPYAMYFFLVTSWLLLFLAFQGKRLLPLFAAGLFFAFSTSLHMSALGAYPVFILASFLTLRAQKASLGKYLFFFLFLGTVTIALFLPPIIHNYALGSSPFSSLGTIINQIPSDLAAFLNERVRLLIKILPFLSAVAFFGSFFYLKKEKEGPEKKIYLLLSFGVGSFLIIFSLIDGRFFDQHLYPVFPFLVIIASENLSKLTRNFWPLAKYLLIASLVILSFRGATDKAMGFSFVRLKSAQLIAASLAGEVRGIKDANGKKDFHFFRFQVYAPPESEWFEGNRDIIDSIYWLALEEETGAKLVEVADNDFEARYKSLDSGEYIFLDCLNYHQGDHDCLERFLADFPKFRIESKIPIVTNGNSFYVARITEE